MLEISAFILSVVGVVLGWLGLTQNKRWLKKSERLKKRIDLIESYSSKNGYRIIVRDSFHYFSYTIGLYFLSEALSGLPNVYPISTGFAISLDNIAIGMQLGAACVLFMHFLDLSKVYKKEEEISKLKKKLEKLQREIKPEI